MAPSLPRLRPYQRQGVDKFLATPAPQRQIFAWCLGAGKTGGAIVAARELDAKRILVVCPALVRPAWMREFATWWPEVHPGQITVGRRAISMSKKGLAKRDATYRAPIKVTSYQLMRDAAETDTFDLVIIDEAHRLRNPNSRQSQDLKSIMRRNPKAAVLMLTATLVPNEIRQIWNPLNILQPNILGKPQNNGRESWQFLNTYCHAIRNEYGVNHVGFKADLRDRLVSIVGHLVHEVGEAAVAPYLPPLFAESLTLDSDRFDVKQLCRDWLDDALAQSAHVGIFCHLNATRQLIFDALNLDYPMFEIDAGCHGAEARDRILAEARAAKSAVVVSTTHAVGEGVSLSFLKSALILEWTTAIDEVLQFMGRFARQDSTNQLPTFLRFVVGPSDGDRAELIQRRIADKNALLLPGRADTIAHSLFAPLEYSDEVLDAMTETNLKSWEAGQAFADWGEDDD